jgi:hypothetical protein
MKLITLILVSAILLMGLAAPSAAADRVCPACAAVNVSKAVYCKSCGKSLERIKDETRSRSLSGIRIGCTYIWSNHGPNGKEQDSVLVDNKIDPPFITQFGWQFERQFGIPAEGAAGVVSVVLLGGGFNQGKIIPSASALMGFRLKNGFEFGGGPNAILSMTEAGNYTVEPGFAWTTGYSVRVGKLVLPLNVAVVQYAAGVRPTFLTGIIW